MINNIGNKNHCGITSSAEEKRGKIKISHDITERPAGAENRSELGHWEADTVVGKQGKACLVTLVDRKSRYLLCGKADGKNAQAVSKTMIDLLLGAKALSVTPDRGKEFARHEEVTEYLADCLSTSRSRTSLGREGRTRTQTAY